MTHKNAVKTKKQKVILDSDQTVTVAERVRGTGGKAHTYTFE